MTHIRWRLNIPPPPPLFSKEDLQSAFGWICELRKDYSPNNDIWHLRRNWNTVKHTLLEQLNDGSYQFSALDRYEFEDGILSLWSSQDMIVLKLITCTLHLHMGNHIPKSCYHVKGHGGLKKAVKHTHEALPEYRYVMRSDIKSYYESIHFNTLMTIIETYVNHKILLQLIYKACCRTETRGGIFYEYNTKSIPKGSPLSPLLGAIALIPLDHAMEKMKGVFYARFMDDWVVLTKSKTALRNVIKRTHAVMHNLKFKLHPMKTYIGKISHGFNFLAFYMDHQAILPSKETIRRFSERSSALYEQYPHDRSRHKRSERDISEYQVNESAPTDADFTMILETLKIIALKNQALRTKLQKYIRKWANWLVSGLSEVRALKTCVYEMLPSLAAVLSNCATGDILMSEISRQFV